MGEDSFQLIVLLFILINCVCTLYMYVVICMCGLNAIHRNKRRRGQKTDTCQSFCTCITGK